MRPLTPTCPHRSRSRVLRAFVRLDLLAGTVAAGLLACLCLAATTQEQAQRVTCANHLRQLGIAAHSYSDENDGEFPARRSPPNDWLTRLKSYHQDDRVTQCPTGRESELTKHSYLMNGFADFINGIPPAMRQEDIPEPSDTILFGEKNKSSLHLYMDFSLGDDLDDLDSGRHLRSGPAQTGGSNHTFADGSVRFLPWGASMFPVNLWATLPAWRTNSIPMP
jgi:hypothetical protein